MLLLKVERRVTDVGPIRSIDCPKTGKREIAYFCKHCKHRDTILEKDIIECFWEEKYREPWKH